MYRFLVLLLAGTSYLGGEAGPILNPTPVHEAYILRFTDIPPPTIIAKHPPAPNNERIPPRPYEDAIWIPGYFAYVSEKGEFTWVCGIWRRPPPNQVWITGEWIQHEGGFVWARGFWSPVSSDKLTYLPIPPPKSITDKVPNSPGQNYFWIPGYWDYSTQSGQYTWLSGKWESWNENWVLAPANYIWRPSGSVFVPIYWDWPLSSRGRAYTCHDATATLEPEVMMRQLFIYYPDYLTCYWHWCHFHPDFWDGCWCLPPWWNWSDWWTFSCYDLWGLWWWWGHPGFYPPNWMTQELSLRIADPSLKMLDFFKKVPKPYFPIQFGNKPLLPKGPPGTQEIPRPQIPSDIIPGGQVKIPEIPNIPGRQVTPPPAPPPQPSYPSEPVYPPQNQEPPRYYPPQNREPQRYYPPQNQKPQRYYPQRPRRPRPPPSTMPGRPPSNTPPPSQPQESTPNEQPSRPYIPPSNVRPEFVPQQQRPSRIPNRKRPSYKPQKQQGGQQGGMF